MTFARSFTQSFGFFAYAACWITIYRLYVFLHPTHQALAASNQEALWRILLVCLLFVIQHSSMATPQWKSFWSALRKDPRFSHYNLRATSKFASAQRSAYALSSAVFLEILMFFWMGSPTIVWNLDSPLMASFCKYTYPISWAALVYQLIALDHFELFGLTQTLGHLHIPFMKVTRKFQRAQLPHPVFLPVVILLAAVPRMTFDRLVLTLGAGAYLLARNDVRPADWTQPL